MLVHIIRQYHGINVNVNGIPWYWRTILYAPEFLSFCKYLAWWWPTQTEKWKDSCVRRIT